MKKIGVCILALLILMPLIVAVEINIKTLPEHRLYIRVQEAGNLNSNPDSKIIPDTETGEVSYNSGVGYSNIDIYLKLSKDGEEKFNKWFREFSTSAPININFMSEDEAGIVDSFEEEEEAEEESEEETEENETEVGEEVVEEEPEEVVEEVQESGPGITGAAISGIKGVFASKTTYYIIGGIFIIGVLFFIVFIAKKKLGSKGIKNFSVRDYDRRLSDAERKLDSAKKELDDLKDRKRRLEEARERFRKDQEELKRMERDY